MTRRRENVKHNLSCSKDLHLKEQEITYRCIKDIYFPIPLNLNGHSYFP
jgi:hypothetical protein